MSRNRFLFDMIGIIAAAACVVPVILFGDTGSNNAFGILGGGILGGAILLGFFAYKNDGVKIAAIFSALVAIGGIIIGVVLLTGGANLFGEVNTILEAIFGTAFGSIMIILGIIFIIASVVLAGLFIGFTAIGSAIGEAVWKDKQKEKFSTGVPVQPYQPSQTPYQPVQPAQPSKPTAVACKHCGASTPTSDKFCTNCGAKI